MGFTTETGRARRATPGELKLQARRIVEEMQARAAQEAQALEAAAQADAAQADAALHPPLTEAQLAARLRLIKDRHAALIAAGKIKGGHRDPRRSLGSSGCPDHQSGQPPRPAQPLSPF